MSSPYTPPQRTAEASLLPSSRKTAVIGSLLLAAPLLGAGGTIFGLLRAFKTLADNGADPSELARDINVALMSMIYGTGFGLIGVVLVSVALFRNWNREVWFLRSVVLLSIFWCLLFFPVGLIIGIYLLVIFLGRRTEFGENNKLAERDVADQRTARRE